MPAQREPSLKDLLAKTAADAKRLANAQIALAKSELSSTGKRVGTGGALGIATLLIALYAGLFLLLALTFVLVAPGLPVWAGFLIVFGLLVIAAAVTGLLAKRQIEQAKGPELSVIEFERTKAALTGEPATDTPTT